MIRRPLAAACVLIAAGLTVAAGPADNAPPADAADKPLWCTPGAGSSAQIAWPPTFTAAGTLDQQDCGQPGCTSRDTDLGFCRAVGGIEYDWTQRGMVTEYEPCLPLIKPDGGSGEPCSYHFLGGDLYYIYRYQEMIVGEPKTPGPSCCVIEDFPTLSPSFPLYVQQYAEACQTADPSFGPQNARMYAQTMVWLPTPGDPPGFYGYYPQVTQPGTSADTPWATPYGFGGETPGAFSQISYRRFEVQPGSLPTFKVPDVCQEAPPCTMINPASFISPPPSPPPAKVITVGEFLNCLEPVTSGGCALCHTTQTATAFPGQLPCCPGQVWDPDSEKCVHATPGENPPALMPCLEQLTAGGAQGAEESAAAAPAAGAAAVRLLAAHGWR